MSSEPYPKKHAGALVKDVGVTAACAVTGRPKARLGRCYSDRDEHGDRFMPIDVVVQPEAASGFPHVTAALADLRGVTLSCDVERRNAKPGHSVNQDGAPAQRFAMLMAGYDTAITDGKITANQAKRRLRDLPPRKPPHFDGESAQPLKEQTHAKEPFHPDADYWEDPLADRRMRGNRRQAAPRVFTG